MSKQYLYTFIAILSGMVMLVLVALLLSCYAQARNYKHIAILVDSNFSQAAAVTIKKKLFSYLDKYTPYDLCTMMKASFPCIDSIALDLYTPQTVAYTIKAMMPLYRINDQFVLGSNKVLLSKAWYHKMLVDPLPTIGTTENLTVGSAPPGLCLLAQRITPELIHEYDMVFHDETETRLTHKTLDDFSIICNANCLNKKQVYDICKDIYTHIRSNAVCQKQHTVAVQADVRFTHQIVVQTEQKRVRHG